METNFREWCMWAQLDTKRLFTTNLIQKVSWTSTGFTIMLNSVKVGLRIC